MVFGTFSERSFPLVEGELARPNGLPPAGSVRRWLSWAHASLAQRLPPSPAAALLTDDLVRPDGSPRDVFAHFGLQAAKLGSLRTNWHGLAHTAQAAGAGREGAVGLPEWSGFEDVWAPGFDGLTLAGRMGWADGGVLADGGAAADAIVILPGLLGDNRVLRTRDLAQGLRRCGFHVLALELRGHGRTDQRTPGAAYTFSSLETHDLLAVSRWLQSDPRVRRTGLIGFCWGANHALCTAWYDGCGGVHPGVEARIAAHLPALPSGRHFEAGIMAFSPVLRFEELLDQLDTPRSRIREPALAGLQSTVRERMQRKGYPEPSGSLRALIACELQRSPLAGPHVEADSYRFVRMLPYRDRPDDAKLNTARVPVLVVHAANDPLASAQDMADLFARISNPHVAGVVLPGGGHIGFGPYARDYYFSLIASFFDPRLGAAHSVPEPGVSG